MPETQTQAKSKICSQTEYGLLKEIIVGRVENSILPSSADWDFILSCYRWTSRITTKLNLLIFGNKPLPKELISLAQQELDALVKILEDNDVNVSRPDYLPEKLSDRKIKTNDWESYTALSACPRDIFFVLGNTILISSSPCKHRFEEWKLYENLLNEYKNRGARIIHAPEPKLSPKSYTEIHKVSRPKVGPPKTYAITEEEILFEGADFVRCGHIVLYQKSNVTNQKGIDWVKRQFSSEDYLFVEVKTKCAFPFHIDTTISCIGNKSLLINPEYVDKHQVEAALANAGEADWSIHIAPKPDKVQRKYTEYDFSSAWLSVNFLSLNEQTILVEEDQPSLIKFLESLGKTIIPVSLKYLNQFGGGIHCVTTDVVRN